MEIKLIGVNMILFLKVVLYKISGIMELVVWLFDIEILNIYFILFFIVCCI